MAVVTVTNLIEGPGTIYKGVFGAVEPLDASVNAAPATSAWTDLGGTKDGSTLTIEREFHEMEVDQVVDIPERRVTKRDASIKTNLAEATLENLALASNDSAPTTGANFKSYTPANVDSATQVTYFAIILDGYAPGGFRRRVIGRRMLNTTNIELAYKKDDQTVIPVEFHAHYVSTSTTPYKIVDQTV